MVTIALMRRRRVTRATGATKRKGPANAEPFLTIRCLRVYCTSFGPDARGVSFSCMMPSRRATSV